MHDKPPRQCNKTRLKKTTQDVMTIAFVTLSPGSVVALRCHESNKHSFPPGIPLRPVNFSSEGAGPGGPPGEGIEEVGGFADLSAVAAAASRPAPCIVMHPPATREQEPGASTNVFDY